MLVLNDVVVVFVDELNDDDNDDDVDTEMYVYNFDLRHLSMYRNRSLSYYYHRRFSSNFFRDRFHLMSNVDRQINIYVIVSDRDWFDEMNYNHLDKHRSLIVGDDVTVQLRVMSIDFDHEDQLFDAIEQEIIVESNEWNRMNPMME